MDSQSSETKTGEIFKLWVNHVLQCDPVSFPALPIDKPFAACFSDGRMLRRLCSSFKPNWVCHKNTSDAGLAKKGKAGKILRTANVEIGVVGLMSTGTISGKQLKQFGKALRIPPITILPTLPSRHYLIAMNAPDSPLSWTPSHAPCSS